MIMDSQESRILAEAEAPREMEAVRRTHRAASRLAAIAPSAASTTHGAADAAADGADAALIVASELMATELDDEMACEPAKAQPSAVNARSQPAPSRPRGTPPRIP